MKKALLCIFVIFTVSLCFAQTVTFKTGDFFALSVADYFSPMDINVTGCKCSITGIKNTEKDIWCINITVYRSASSVPIVYNYYVKQGDIIKMRRINSPIGECSLKVVSVKWNEVTLDIQ